MDKKLYKFGMDWLNGVLPVEDVSEVFKLLGQFSGKLRFERWQLTNSGKYNYSRRYCLDGNASMQIMYNPVSDEESFTACKPLEQVSGQTVKGTSNNPYIFFSISGDGIRYLHTLGGEVSALNKLLFYFYRHDFRASRFDVYCDILDKDNKVVPLIEEAFQYFIRPLKGKPSLVTRFQRKSENVSLLQNFDENGDPYFNCVLGNHGSSIGMFRSYNKYEEVRTGRLARLDVKGTKNKQKDFNFEMSMAKQLFTEYGVFDYWYRLEYELHKDNAAAYFSSLMKNAENCNSPLCFEDIFFSVFDRMFTVINYSMLNVCENSTNSDWSEFRDELSSSNEYFV